MKIAIIKPNFKVQSKQISQYLCILPQGYLKMSIMVIGPGDEPKRSPAYVSPEEVDIER